MPAIIICDADDCLNNNRKTGKCKLREIYVGRLHCQNYEMDKEYLDAQLKEQLRERMYAFPRYELGVEDIAFVRTREELDARLSGKLPYHAPPEKAGEEEKKNAKN